MLGNEKLKDAMMNVILIAKVCIYQCKMKNSVPNLQIFRNSFKLSLRTEKYIDKIEQNMAKFESKWVEFIPLFDNDQG